VSSAWGSERLIPFSQPASPTSHARALSRGGGGAAGLLHMFQGGCRWVSSQIHQFLPFQQAVAVIEAKDSGRDLTDCRQRFDGNSIVLKMIGPTIGAWVKEPGKLACLPYDRPNVAALMAITKGTGIRQVFYCGRSAVLHADDVIYLTPKVRVILVN
jgi:hypothetical protein